MTKIAVRTSVLLASLVFMTGAAAHAPSNQECAEGSDFIRNAALSRENGMDGRTFLNKMLEDFAMIRSFPASIRWFVKDLQDEDFLLKAATDVFDHPQHPEIHKRDFLNECLARTSTGV